MDQIVEHLPSKCNDSSSIPSASTEKKKKAKQKNSKPKNQNDVMICAVLSYQN
jgi:hypothetical protein